MEEDAAPMDFEDDVVVLGPKPTTTTTTTSSTTTTTTTTKKKQRRRLISDDSKDEEDGMHHENEEKEKEKEKDEEDNEKKKEQVMEEGEEGGGELAFQISGEDVQFNAALYGETVRKGFLRLHNDPLLSDITLVLGEERVPAHKMVLCAWSETFRSMLSNEEWAESSMRELPIHVEEADYEIFKHILNYMYTGTLKFVNGHNIVSIIRLADYYGILSLKEECGNLLGQQISDATLFFLLEIAERFDCRSLDHHCGNFLADNFGDMLENDMERLLSLRLHTWAAMLKSDDLQISSEEDVFDAVLLYASQGAGKEPEHGEPPGNFSGNSAAAATAVADMARREEILNTLLPLVRFNFLSGKFLIYKVETNETLQHLPIVQQLLYETYRFKIYSKAPTTFPTTARKGFQRFDETKCASALRISDDKLTVTNTIAGWYSVRCIGPLTRANPYCEFKFLSGTNVMIGVVVGDCTTTGYAGQYANGYTYYSQGGVYHQGMNSATGQHLTAGGILGVKVDFDGGAFHFYINGTKAGSHSPLPADLDNIYPVVSLSAVGDKVSIVTRPEDPDLAPSGGHGSVASSSSRTRKKATAAAGILRKMKIKRFVGSAEI